MGRAVVLIATRNRWHLLSGCLDSLQEQRCPEGVDLAIRVVDNGSTDGSAAALEAYAATPRHVPMEVLREPVPGKSRALNRGLVSLNCDLLVCTDDDMCLEPGWIAAFWQQVVNGTLSGAQGCIRIQAEKPLPDWFTIQCAGLLGATRETDEPVKGLPGGSMAVRGALLPSLGQFREDLGPHGKRFASGEDVEWSARILDLGGTLGTCREAVAWHRVQASALTRWALWWRQFEYVRRETLVNRGSHRPGIVFRGLVGSLLVRRRHFEGFDYALELAQRCGRLAGLMGRK